MNDEIRIIAEIEEEDICKCNHTRYYHYWLDSCEFCDCMVFETHACDWYKII